MGRGASLESYYHSAHGDLQKDVEALSDSLLLRSAMQLLPDGVAVTKRGAGGGDSRFVFVNSTFAELAGCPAADMCGKTLETAAVPRPDEALWQRLVEIHHSPTQAFVEVIACRIAGVPRVIRLQSVPVCGAAGEVRGRTVILRDISAEKCGDDMAWQNERLVGLGLLATGIAHEINNPVGSALLAAETALAIQGVPGTEDQLIACLNNIVASTDRCGRIVRTLLRYSRDEPSEKQCCSINDVVKQAIDLTRPYAERQSVTVRLEQEIQTPLTLMNPLEIEMVLVNLIRNAIEASSKDAEVQVRTEWVENAVRVWVSDHGCGMTTEQIAHMFDPLYTTRKSAGGCGLGLAIAAGIVQRHAGCMEAFSEPGAGTTVVVDLPVAATPSTEGNQVRADSYGANSDCRGREASG